MPQINGVICNALIFYDSTFQIIENLNAFLMRHILTNEANSLLLFGRKGDNNLFSTIEKSKLINLAFEITEHKIPILIGIYGNHIDEIIDQIDNLGKRFIDLNYLISPPISEKMSTDALKSYFENILGSINPHNYIYLLNNPLQFSRNEIDPNLLNSLIQFTNLKGIDDSFYNIKNCKSYIQLLNENFSVFCGMEENAQAFFQLIPITQRKYSGIVSNISNLVNMCSKLYNFAVEDNILELLQLQDQINDIRIKIYNFKDNENKETLGLKYAFLYLYKELISKTNNNITYITKELNDQIDSIIKERIEATVNYLLNLKQIYQLYYIGKKDIYQFSEIIKTFSQVDELVSQGKVKKIKGPYIVDTNTIYRVRFENSQIVFKFQAEKTLQIDNLIKEKLLYPFLDKSLNPNDLNLQQKVKEIILKKKGKYIFSKERPPIIPVCNIIYYDETKELVPSIFSAQEYIRGKPLFQVINQYITEGKNLQIKKFENLFGDLGEYLGTLHEIQFDSFFPHINDIGNNKKTLYSEYFEIKLENDLQEAKKNNLDLDKEILNYYRNNKALIDDETDYVLLHNNFQSQNIIVKEDLGVIKINGIVDFDKWCIGSRAQDFIKIDYFILKPLNIPLFYNTFNDAYSKHYKIDKEFKKKIELHKLLWLLNEYNYESELIKKSDQRDSTSLSSISLENYKLEIKSIIQ
ncbi:MAG: dihydrodipicolinate synthase family protein [Promethearchaeota archaeon]